MKDEPLDEEPSLPPAEAALAAPFPVAPPRPLPEEPVLDEELLLEEALVVPVADTVCPTSPDSDTIVPSAGAYSFVSCTACSSLLTVSLSVLMAALAEARFASRVAALCVCFDASVLAGLVALDSVEPAGEVEPDGLEDVVLLAGAVVVVFGAVVVFGLVVGVLVVVVVVVVGAPPDGEVVVPAAGAEPLLGADGVALAWAKTAVV